MRATTIGPDSKGRFTPVIDMGDEGKLYGPKKFESESATFSVAENGIELIKSDAIRRGWTTKPW